MKRSLHAKTRAAVATAMAVTVIVSLALRKGLMGNSSPYDPTSTNLTVSHGAIDPQPVEDISAVYRAYAVLATSFVKVRLEKVADIQLEEKEAFFLSILSLNSTLLASYRASLSAYTTNVIQLDKDFVPKLGTKITVDAVEDARVFQLKGEGWLVDNHFLNRRVLVTVDGSRRVHLDETSIPNFVRGKNWSPFTYNEELYFVYSLKPLKVLRCDLNTGKITWAFQEPQVTEFGAEQLNEMLTRGGTNSVVHDGFVYGIGRETKYMTVSCGGKTHDRVAQHFPLLWRFPLIVFEPNFSSSPNRVVDKDLIETQELEHPFRKGVNDPASLFVRNSTMFVTISSCSCACLPEFRIDANVQHNSVYKLLLS